MVAMAYTLGYARVSRSDQSLETQLYLFQREGFNELFVEKISGRREDRPEFEKLCARALELAALGQLVEVLFVEFSRWGRNTSYTLAQVERLEKAGVKLRELHGGDISVATASDLLSTGMKALLAHYYSVELSERVSRAYERRRANRAPLCGNAPFGYRYSDDHTKLVPDEREWPIARQIVERLLAGESKYSIRRWLLSDYGIKRSGDGINQLVRCEAWRGNLVDRKNNRIIHNTHEALISESERTQLLARIAQNRRLKGKNQGKLYPIPSQGAGLVRCLQCGFAEQTSTTNGRRYFRCIRIDCPSAQKYLRSEAIEAAIQNAIQDAADTVIDAVAASVSGNHHANPEIAKLEAEIEQLRPLAHRPAVALEIEQIESELQHLKAAPAHDAIEAAERRELVQGLGQISGEDWEKLSVQKRHDIYLALVESVIVDKHEVVEVRLRPF